MYDVRDLLNATVKLRDGKKATDMDMGFIDVYKRQRQHRSVRRKLRATARR